MNFRTVDLFKWSCLRDVYNYVYWNFKDMKISDSCYIFYPEFTVSINQAGHGRS